MTGSWPFYDKDEIDAAVACLASGRVNYWTGEECKRFEKEFANYHGVKHGVALANGTVALELALMALGIRAGDEVIVTPRSFFASAGCVARVGATPVFVDVDAESQNMTADTIAKGISQRTKAIILVHLAGWPCAMAPITELAAAHGVAIIEDCAQAHGARYRQQPVGSFGAVSAFSFCQDKIMSTAGEGGMLVTSDPAIWKRAWEFKDHGKRWDLVYSKDHEPGFRWLHGSFGSNWRLTEPQAAIGRLQLQKLDDWVQRRRANADRLARGFADLTLLRVPLPGDDEYHAYYRFYTFVRPERLKPGWSRNRILKEFEERGIPGLSGSCPEIYREQAFAGSDFGIQPVAKELGETSMMFLVHPTLHSEEVERVIEVVRTVCKLATK